MTEGANKIVVIGGGAAGLFAAITALENGADSVIVVEHNEKLGKKMYITGKGRCNFTNTDDEDAFLQNVVTNPKFLFSSMRALSPSETVQKFEEWGLPSKVERGGRVFPQSDKSSDVTSALERRLKRLGGTVALRTDCLDILTENGAVKAVRTDGDVLAADAVILATGGVSYPATGSTGDGYVLASRLGHTVVPPLAALVSIKLRDKISTEGLSLKNVRLTILDGAKPVFSDMGEMLYTADGISGPIVLSASSHITRHPRLSSLTASIDLKPALSERQLDDRLLRDFETLHNKDFKNALDELLPRTLIPEFLVRLKIPLDKKINQITLEERRRIVMLLKNLSYGIEGLSDIKSAVITSGGVDVKDVSPATMQSKLITGLFFAGELLDVDALTGGYNLQIAFSTGCLAGKNAAGHKKE